MVVQPQSLLAREHMWSTGHGGFTTGVMQSLYLRGKMQEMQHDAAFTLFLHCDVFMEVLGAHWDVGQRWPGAAELEFLGVQVTGCCW